MGFTYAVVVYFRSFFLRRLVLMRVWDAAGCSFLIAENVATFLMLSDGRIYGGEFNVKFDASRHNSHLDDANRVKFGLNPR